MSSLREVKSKMVATKKTSQITNAMYMVSVAKLKRAENKFMSFAGFIDTTEKIVAQVMQTDDARYHPLLEQREVKKVGYLLITSDKGLAGAYNSHLIKKFKEDIKKHKSKDEFSVGVLGMQGYKVLRKMDVNLVQDNPVNIRDDVLFMDIKDLITNIINLFIGRSIDKLVVYYNHFENKMTQHVVAEQILPFKNIETTKKTNYIFEPSPNAILDRLLPIYAENKIYGYILDSKASEHAARMRSMKSATDNASDMIDTLNILYNRARQTAITQEITEIVSGANALE